MKLRFPARLGATPEGAATVRLSGSRRRAVIARRLASVVLLLALATAEAMPASAQSADCSGSADERQLLACHQSNVSRQGRELDTLLARLAGRADDELRKLLTKSQRAWLQYRDAECAVRTFESRLGTAAETLLLACVGEMNLIRIRELREAVDNP